MRTTLPLALLLLVGCPPAEDDTGDTDPPGDLTCGTLDTLVTEDALLAAWFADGGYGVNHAFLWDVEDRGTEGAPEWYYTGSEVPLTPTIPRLGWTFPATPRWSAFRPVRTDGYDPMAFTEEAPFWLGYLPAAPSVGWEGAAGVQNDGTCPGSGGMVGDLPTCVGTAQLDPAHPYPLTAGQSYQFQLLFGLNINETGNRVVACYQATITWADR